jgi:serine/threonine protein phosphatase PrpC
MLETFSLSDTGCVRPNNEDYCRVLPEIGLFLLADGMGGARGGETASRLAVDTIADTLQSAPARDASTLLKAVEESNLRVLDQANRDVRLEGMGTTVVAALHTGTADDGTEDIAIASVGDSRAYLLDETGLRAITQDQTWVHEVGKPLGLDEESLRTHPMRHVLTMAIGVGSTLTIKYYMVSLRPGATLLLSSDGLHGVAKPDQIEKILKEPSTLEQKCRHLVEAARTAGGPDNISCVLIRAAVIPAPAV